MTSWRITPQLNLQLNAINLFDKLYYDRRLLHLRGGEPRHPRRRAGL